MQLHSRSTRYCALFDIGKTGTRIYVKPKPYQILLACSKDNQNFQLLWMWGISSVLLLLSTAHVLVSAFLQSSFRGDRHELQCEYKSNQFDSEAATAVDIELQDITKRVTSRRNILRDAFMITSGMYCGSGKISCALAASNTYTSTGNSRKVKMISSSGRLVDQVVPDEKETYAKAQNLPGILKTKKKRILWVGAGTMRGVYKNLFQAGNEVIALDLVQPDVKDLNDVTVYATEHGYQLRFEQGDATNLQFADETFDVVVSSMFLCQDFDPEVVVSEIQRVLKPGGRFGFYEHVADIDRIIVSKVFSERSVIRVQAYPEQTNVVAGVVKKI